MPRARRSARPSFLRPCARVAASLARDLMHRTIEWAQVTREDYKAMAAELDKHRRL